MKYAFFPGCVLEGAAKECYDATVLVAAALGIELTEIDGWTCCGASHLQDVDELAALAVNARNIALAEQLQLPLLTVCNTCALMLRQAKAQLDGTDKERVNRFLEPAGIQYSGGSEVTHLLWALIQDYGVERLKSKVVRPLTHIRAAAYYGCHLLRPPEVMGFEDPDQPDSLEKLIAALGATVVPYEAQTECCGFHAAYTAEADVHKLTGQNNRGACLAGANCLVTPCPLCQMQLDMFQPEGQAAVGGHPDLPVLHLAQLIGLALGIDGRALGLQRHVVRAGVLAGS